jgi:hypothetical protein
MELRNHRSLCSPQLYALHILLTKNLAVMKDLRFDRIRASSLSPSLMVNQLRPLLSSGST